MPTIRPNQWEGSDDWKTIVTESMHDEFRRHIASAEADGYTVTGVVVGGGVPIMYQVSRDD
jgi:hypothetical protein